MQYFDSALSQETFEVIGSRLKAEIDRAQPRLHTIAEEKASKPRSAGKWTRQQILGHLIDSAANNHQRFVRASLQGELSFPGYDQEKLVDLQKFTEMDWGFIVDFWAAYNRFLAHVLSVLPAKAAPVTCKIGNGEPATLQFIAEDYVAHLKHHLNQIVGKKFETSYGAKA